MRWQRVGDTRSHRDDDRPHHVRMMHKVIGARAGLVEDQAVSLAGRDITWVPLDPASLTKMERHDQAAH